MGREVIIRDISVAMRNNLVFMLSDP